MKTFWIVLLSLFVGIGSVQAQGLPENLQVDEAFDNPLPVLFKAQVPPGSWSKTANCGQASVNMAIAYHQGVTPTAEGIMRIDEFLVQKPYRRNLNNYNSQGTQPNMLRDAARVVGGFPDSYYEANWTLQDFRDAVDDGLPVVARVYTGYLKNRPYRYVGNHYVLVIGYTSTHIICNDPGGVAGGGVRYENSQFAAASKKVRGYAIVVMPND